MIRCVFFLSMSVCSVWKYSWCANWHRESWRILFFPSVPSAWLTFETPMAVLFSRKIHSEDWGLSTSTRQDSRKLQPTSETFLTFHPCGLTSLTDTLIHVWNSRRRTIRGCDEMSQDTSGQKPLAFELGDVKWCFVHGTPLHLPWHGSRDRRCTLINPLKISQSIESIASEIVVENYENSGVT